MRNCTSLDFFFPIRMGWWRLKWMQIIISCSHVYKMACLIFLNGISTTSPLLVVYLNPFWWHSSIPLVFFYVRLGLIFKSLSTGRFPLISWSFSCSTTSSARSCERNFHFFLSSLIFFRFSSTRGFCLLRKISSFIYPCSSPSI